jgi:hypothetical protein
MVTTTATLDLPIWRNDDVYELPLRVIGPNLTGVPIRAQIRRAGDEPGPALVSLELVAAGEGIRLASVTSIDGVWQNDLRIQINKATRQGLGYAGVPGASQTLRWGLKIAGITRIQGRVILPPHVMDSDNAPEIFDAPYNFARQSEAFSAPIDGATLTIAANNVVQLAIDGADLVERAASLSKDSADRSQANAAATGVDAGKAALFASTALSAIGGLMYTTVEAGAAANLDGKPFSVMGDGPNTFAILYSVRTTVFDFRNGAAPAGASVKRAAGAYSRYKRLEYTDFDFTAGVLPAGVTVQRAAGPWSRRSQTGALELGTAANVPRFDYDPPVNGAAAVCRGLMLEPARTNYFQNSDTLTGRASSGTITYSAGRTSPTGAQAARIAFGDNAVIAPLANTAITAGQAWTASIYSVADAVTTINFGTNGLTASGNNKGVTAAVDVAWSRLTYTNTPATADTGMYISFGTGGVGTGTGGSLTARTVEASGIQMELGATASSYIPTTTTAATRPAETISIAVPGMADGSYVCSLFYAPGSYGGTASDVSLGRVVSGVMTVSVPDSQRPGVVQTLRVASLPSSIMEFGTAADTPRFDYDPATGASRGVLIEPASTNLQVGSGVINTPNFRIYATRSAGSPGPDGLASNRFGRSSSRTDGAAFDQYPSDYGSGNNVPRTFSAFVKNFDAATISLFEVTAARSVILNTATGALTSTNGAVGTVAIAPRGTSRLSLAGVKANQYGYYFGRIDQASTTSTATAEFSYVQLEAGLRATTYIPTTTAAATRPLETLTLQGGSGLYRVTFDDGSTQDLNLIAVDGVVSIPGSTLNRYNVLTVAGMVPVEGARYVGKPVVDQALSANSYTSLAAFKASDIGRQTAGLVGVPNILDGRFNWKTGDFTGKADDVNIIAGTVALTVGAWVRQIEAAARPSTGTAFSLVTAAAVTGGVVLQPRGYALGGTANFSDGATIQGTRGSRGAASFEGAGDAPALMWSAMGGGDDRNGPLLTNFTVYNLQGIAIGDRSSPVTEAGGQTVFHYTNMERLNVIDSVGGGARNDNSVGVSITKGFNSQLTLSEILGFRIGVLLNGSDICVVAGNRIYNWERYGILETSALTFGSQNTVRENDILGSPKVANGASYKSTGRHISLFNNYFEPQGAMAAGAGFIDISPLGIPSYGGNSPGATLSIWIDANRVDSQGLGSYVHRIDPAEARTIVVRGRQTSDGSNAPSLFINAAGTRTDTIPIHVGVRQRQMEVFETTFGPLWHGHRDEPEVSLQGGRFTVTARNKSALPANTIVTGRTAFVRHQGDFLIIPPGMPDQPIPIFPGYGSNNYFGEAANFKVTVVARSTEAGDTISLQQAGLDASGNGFGTGFETKPITKTFRSYSFVVPGRAANFQALGLHIKSQTSIGTIFFYVFWEELV